MTVLQQCHVMAILGSEQPCYLKTIACYAEAKIAEVAEFLLGFKQPPTSELAADGGNHGDTQAALYLSDIFGYLRDANATDEGLLFGPHCAVPIQLQLALRLSNGYPPLFVKDYGREYINVINTLLSCAENRFENPEFEWSRERGKPLIEILRLAISQWSKALNLSAGWSAYVKHVVGYAGQSLSSEARANVLPVLKKLPFHTSPYADFKPRINW
jgi:hypothetical protein